MQLSRHVTTAAARVTALLGTLTVGWLLTSAPAYAVEPFTLPDELVDQSAVIQDEAAVRAAQDRLFDGTGLQLFVVYVDDFSGLSGPEWADQTAELSGLGDKDLLVAVATQDRSWGDSISHDSGLSDGQLDDVAADFIEPELRANDWDGAAIGAAEGYLEAATAPSTGWYGVAGVGGVALAGYGLHRGRKWSRARKAREEQQESLEQSSQRIGGLLVALDSALTAAEGELQYAEAEFSPDLTTPFREALTASRQESLEAYRLRETIGQQDPETDYASMVDRYRSLEQLVTRAGARLDEHATAFNELRALADRAPQRIEELVAAFAAVSLRAQDGVALAEARADLPTGQRERIGVVSHECQGLHAQGRQALEQARERVAAGEPEDAVMPLKAAEEALSGLTGRADLLGDLDALQAQWSELLSTAAASLSRDVADAARLAPQDPAVTQPAQDARTALARVGDPGEDPVELAQDLGDIERALDGALGTYREAEERRLKEVKAATDQLARSRATVDAMRAELSSNRAHANNTALSRASEAQSLLAQGEALIDTDPGQAHPILREAANRASSAMNSISSVRASAQESSSSGWGSSWSGSSSSSRSRSRNRSRSRSRSSRSRSSSRRSSRSSRSSRGGRF